MNYKLITTSIALVATVALGVGCSKKGDDAPASDSGITISGSLSTAAASSIINSKIGLKPGDANAFAVTLNDLEIYAYCLAGKNSAIGQADVGTDGSFSVNLACPTGSFVSAVFRYKSSFEEVGAIVFKDTSQIDSNTGEAKESSSIALSGAVQLGTISLGSDGKVTIDVASIKSSVASSDSATTGTPFDFHGVWTASAYDGTLQKGYTTTCVTQGPDCHGPPEGMAITLVRLAGKAFTPTSCTKANGELSGTCTVDQGTLGTTDKYGISIWGGDASATGESAGIGACGYKLGFSADQARAFGGIHIATAPTLSNNQLLLEEFSFSTPSGYGGDTGVNCGTSNVYCNQPWMKNDSTASWTMQDCSTVNLTGSDSKTYKVFACKINAWNSNHTAQAYKYSAHLSDGGGCFDSSGKPIRVEKWDNQPTSCTNADHPALANFQVGSCTYENKEPITGQPATNYTCRWAGGKSSFTDTTLSTQETTYTRWDGTDYVTLVSSGQHCKNIAVASSDNILMKYRCYASNNHGGGKGGGSCGREYRFNWETNDPTKFVVTAGREKPNQAFITDIAQYSADGNSLIVNNIEVEQASVFANNQNVICNVEKSTTINTSKMSDTKLLIDVQEKGRVMDIDKPVCRAVADCIGKLIKANIDGGGNGILSEDTIRTGCAGNGGDLVYRLLPTKMKFYMNK